MKQSILTVLVICALALGFSSCLKQVVQEPDNSVKLTFDTIRITQGITQFLTAKNYPSNRINWSSSDTSIVKIGADGLINAIKPGQVTINAVAKEYATSAKCIVIVLGSSFADTRVSDVSVGADGSIFAIGIDVVSPTGGFGIYKVVGNKLNKIPYCAGVRIAVGPDGKPWVVNKSNLIFKYRDSVSAWQQMPGTATDIAIGANGAVYAIGTNDVSPTGGKNIMRWTGSNWVDMPECAGIHIAVSATGIPWVANKINLVYKFSGIQYWDAVNGVTANDIGIGADGSVYVTGSDAAAVYKLNSSTNAWAVVPGLSGTSISVTPNGLPVYIDKAGILHKP